MAKSRIELQTLLENVLESRNVYFQPPESIRMEYPAIIYSLNRINNNHANNSVYIKNKEYELIVIDRDPESEIVDRLSELPLCRFDRSYKADDLNHFVFTLYF
jgi:hypothetical protein